MIIPIIVTDYTIENHKWYVSTLIILFHYVHHRAGCKIVGPKEGSGVAGLCRLPSKWNPLKLWVKVSPGVAVLGIFEVSFWTVLEGIENGRGLCRTLCLPIQKSSRIIWTKLELPEVFGDCSIPLICFGKWHNKLTSTVTQTAHVHVCYGCTIELHQPVLGCRGLWSSLL